MFNQAQLIAEIQQAADQVQLHSNKATELFKNALIDTVTHTVTPQNTTDIFVATGDIPAMWLRDSTFQVLPYLQLIQTVPQVKTLIQGVLNQQLAYVRHDPYANAFNQTASGAHYTTDSSNIPISDLVWERKFEIDSLCAPLHLAAQLYQTSGTTEHLTPEFWQTVALIMATFIREQHHETSDYVFNRPDCPPSDTLSHEGHGAPIGYTGMVWSGFRPSDDACQYGYLVPGNMYIVVVITELLALIGAENIDQPELVGAMTTLKEQIETGIADFAVVRPTPTADPIWAYEVDGLGHVNLMDDANVPSLLSAPFLGYCSIDEPLYQQTRGFILSPANPYFYAGQFLARIGSPHTPPHHVWPIALAMVGLTTTNLAAVTAQIDLIAATDNGTLQCHEGVHVDNPAQYTREWFSWANMTYCQLVFHYLALKAKA